MSVVHLILLPASVHFDNHWHALINYVVKMHCHKPEVCWIQTDLSSQNPMRFLTPTRFPQGCPDDWNTPPPPQQWRGAIPHRPHSQASGKTGTLPGSDFRNHSRDIYCMIWSDTDTGKASTAISKPYGDMDLNHLKHSTEYKWGFKPCQASCPSFSPRS